MVDALIYTTTETVGRRLKTEFGRILDAEAQNKYWLVYVIIGDDKGVQLPFGLECYGIKHWLGKSMD
jgi:hypothetical protein